MLHCLYILILLRKSFFRISKIISIQIINWIHSTRVNHISWISGAMRILWDAGIIFGIGVYCIVWGYYRIMITGGVIVRVQSVKSKPLIAYVFAVRYRLAVKYSVWYTRRVICGLFFYWSVFTYYGYYWALIILNVIVILIWRYIVKSSLCM